MDCIVRYSEADSGWAKWIAWTLREAGYSAELRAMPTSPDLSRLPKEQIHTSHCTIIIVSQAYPAMAFARSSQMKREHSPTSESVPCAIPVRIDASQSLECLEDFHYVDLTGRDKDQARAALYAIVNQYVAPSNRPPTFPRGVRAVGTVPGIVPDELRSTREENRPRVAPTDELVHLLTSLFEVEELRRFVRTLSDGASLDASLPGPPVSLNNFASAVVELLRRYGRLDTELFDRLIEVRVGRRADIERIRRHLLDISSGGEERHDTPMSDGEALALSKRIERIEQNLRSFRFACQRANAISTALLESFTQLVGGAAELVQELQSISAGMLNDSLLHTTIPALLDMARDAKRLIVAVQRERVGQGAIQGALGHLQTRVTVPLIRLSHEVEEHRRQREVPIEGFFFDDSCDQSDLEFHSSDWLADLLSGDEYRTHAATAIIARNAMDAFLRWARACPIDQRVPVFQALWENVDLLLLESRARAREIFACALELLVPCPLRENWQVLYRLLSKRDTKDQQTSEVQWLLGSISLGNRKIFARALLLHPKPRYRQLARSTLEPSDFWLLISHHCTPTGWLVELWQFLRPQVDIGYLKIFFVCVGDRLTLCSELGAILNIIELLKEFYEIDGFHEDFFFFKLLELDKWVRAHAEEHDLQVEYDCDYVDRMRAFCATCPRRDQPTAGWNQVPLPVQRLLAHRGNFLIHFSCHPNDEIALECLPHIVRRGDLNQFLDRPALNTCLLIALTQYKHLFQTERAKYKLLRHPKTPAYIVLRYIGFLRTAMLKKLAAERDGNPYARLSAQKALKRSRSFTHRR